MGAGIAVHFRNQWPVMFQEYRARCRSGLLRPGGLFTWDDPSGLVVMNLASQNRPGSDARLAYVASCVKAAVDAATDRGIDRVALPRIGCGIGGLSWSDVKTVLLAQETPVVTLELWTLPEVG